MIRLTRSTLVVAAAAVVAAACTGSPAAEVTPATSTTTASTVPASTTTTMPATTTTVAATTTTEPPPDFNELDAALPDAPQASLLVAEVDGDACTAIHEVEANTELAVDTSAGLYLIGAADGSIAEGFFTGWDQPLALQRILKIPIRGELATLEDPGLVFTAQRLGQLLMGPGDTTAFETLIDGMGRQRVEEAVTIMGHSAPFELHPFLTMREALSLKFGDATRLLAYIAEPPDARVLVLDQLAIEVPSAEALAAWETPNAIGDVQWHASTADLCRAMAWLVNRPGPAAALAGSAVEGLDPLVWPFSTSIHGSEPGVFNLTVLLERADQRRFVVSVTLNDPQRPVDEEGARAVVESATVMLADR